MTNTLNLNTSDASGEAMDLDAIAEDLRTLAAMAEAHNAEGAPLGDDFSTILADLAGHIDTWHEVVS
jgi:hypothetical protein